MSPVCPFIDIHVKTCLMCREAWSRTSCGIRLSSDCYGFLFWIKIYEKVTPNRVIDSSMESLKIKVWALVNLSLPLDRARRVLLGTLIEPFGTDSWTNIGLTLPTFSWADSLLSWFQLSLPWSQVEIDESYRFHGLLFLSRPSPLIFKEKCFIEKTHDGHDPAHCNIE